MARKSNAPVGEKAVVEEVVPEAASEVTVGEEAVKVEDNREGALRPSKVTPGPKSLRTR